MLGFKIAVGASHSHETLVMTAVEAFGITLLSSKGNGNPCDQNEKLLVIIRT